jgi:hypothetical protein
MEDDSTTPKARISHRATQSSTQPGAVIFDPVFSGKINTKNVQNQTQTSIPTWIAVMERAKRASAVLRNDRPQLKETGPKE